MVVLLCTAAEWLGFYSWLADGSCEFWCFWFVICFLLCSCLLIVLFGCVVAALFCSGSGCLVIAFVSGWVDCCCLNSVVLL